MAEPARSETLYDAIARLPEGTVGELIDGQLYAHPRPTGPHVGAASALLADLGAPFYRGRGGPGGWWILDEPELHLRRNLEVLVPDLAGWRRARLPALPDDQRFEVVPDWVCEILSPSTASADREVKLPVYARHGVRHAWLVDPRRKTLEVFELRAGAWQQAQSAEGNAPIRAAPFDAVEIPPPWA
jgi:Uma2 family endonuclease